MRVIQSVWQGEFAASRASTRKRRAPQSAGVTMLPGPWYTLHLSKSQQSYPEPLARRDSCTPLSPFEDVLSIPRVHGDGSPFSPKPTPATASGKRHLSF